MSVSVLLAVAGLAVLGLLVLGFAWASQLRKRRREQFAQFARTNGWTWAAQDDSWIEKWTGPPFAQGDQRRARNVVVGEWHGRPFVAFDYSYKTHASNGQGGSTTTTSQFGVCAIVLPTGLPHLEVRPDFRVLRRGRPQGADAISVESEEFNRKFRVSCPDPKFASDVLHPRQMAMLLAARPAAWRIEGAHLLCWGDGRPNPPQVLERLGLLGDILEAIPSFVWRDRGVTLERTGEPSS